MADIIKEDPNSKHLVSIVGEWGEYQVQVSKKLPNNLDKKDPELFEQECQAIKEVTEKIQHVIDEGVDAINAKKELLDVLCDVRDKSGDN